MCNMLRYGRKNRVQPSRGVANSMKFPIVDQQIIRSNKNDLLFSWTQHSGHSLSNNIMYHKWGNRIKRERNAKQAFINVFRSYLQRWNRLSNRKPMSTCYFIRFLTRCCLLLQECLAVKCRMMMRPHSGHLNRYTALLYLTFVKSFWSHLAQHRLDGAAT